MGSLFFTTAAGLQLLVSAGAVPAAGHHPLAAVQWRALRRAPRRAEWWAGIVQFVGTVLFNISTFDALQQALSATEENRRVWTPDALGSIAFLVASGLAFADVRRPWLSWRPRDLGWSVAILNLVGSVAFGISAIASHVVPATGDVRDLQRANLGTFVGALCFLIGAVLLIPGQSVPATTRPTLTIVAVGAPANHPMRMMPGDRFIPTVNTRSTGLVGTAVPRDASVIHDQRQGQRMANQPNEHLRAMLPIPDRPAPGLTTYDAKDPDTAYPPIEPLLPPRGAPNVLVVLLDDVGFGASSAFGGPVHTPVAERLAGGGLKYTRFHTTALCAPTRQALLTGRNHHSVGMGSITETATSAPGNSSLRPNTKAPLALTLKLNGYSTAQFGKCHEVPVWQTSPDGALRRLALRRRRLRVLLRVHRRREQPVRPRARTRAPHRSSRRRRPRRATTSPRTWPTRRSAGCGSRRR